MGLMKWLKKLTGIKHRYPYKSIRKVLGPWQPYPGTDCLPGTSLPRILELPAKAAKWGLKPGRAHIDEVLFPCWLRIDPKIVGWVMKQIREGTMYQRLELKRENKSPRIIHAPAPILKFYQKRILTRVLEQVQVHDAAQGFVRGRSIFSNASAHVGKRIVVCMDLRDFFPSITYKRVAGMFRQLGFTRHTTAKLAALCCFDGGLPQGAPTSPMITNLVCRRLDSRMTGLVSKYGGSYTRYADDITLSGDEDILKVIPLVRRIISEEGFTEAREKFRIQRSGSRQKVTGLNVNTKVSVPRKVRRLIRAMVHSHFVNGGTNEMFHFLMGHISFMRPVHPQQAITLQEQLKG